jgi:L-aspartate oxidase
MSRFAGVRRSGAGLATATAALRQLLHDTTQPTSADAANRWLVASAIVAAASARRESRGCHWRSDFAVTSDAWRRHTVVRLDNTGLPVADRSDVLGRSA